MDLEGKIKATRAELETAQNRSAAAHDKMAKLESVGFEGQPVVHRYLQLKAAIDALEKVMCPEELEGMAGEPVVINWEVAQTQAIAVDPLIPPLTHRLETLEELFRESNQASREGETGQDEPETEPPTNVTKLKKRKQTA